MTASFSASSPEYATILAECVAAVEVALDEARLPIHILLTAQFGDLNENQEEMLGAAEAALHRIANELRTVRTLADADRGAFAVRRDVIRVGDLLRAIQPELRDQAARANVSLALDIEPALPSARADTAQLRDALRLTLSDEIRYAIPGSTVTVEARSTASEILVQWRGAPRAATARLVLAERLLRVQGGRLEHDGGETTILLPRAVQSVPPRAA